MFLWTNVVMYRIRTSKKTVQIIAYRVNEILWESLAVKKNREREAAPGKEQDWRV